MSRLEGLSDAVFALALTLIIVSLEPSATFDNLMGALKQIPVFAVCFAILLMIWYYHFQFHRRYGLEDYGTFSLNSMLLFLILMYVYPLRFVFSGVLAGGEFQGLSIDQGRQLMAIYSAGVTGIFAVLMLLTLRAWKQRDRLKLDDRERLLTKSSILGHSLSAGLGVVSILLVAASHAFGVPLAFAGLIYFLMGPIHGILGWKTDQKAEAIRVAEEAAQSN